MTVSGQIQGVSQHRTRLFEVGIVGLELFLNSLELTRNTQFSGSFTDISSGAKFPGELAGLWHFARDTADFYERGIHEKY